MAGSGPRVATWLPQRDGRDLTRCVIVDGVRLRRLPDGLQNPTEQNFLGDGTAELDRIVYHSLRDAPDAVGLRKPRILLYLYYVGHDARGFHRHVVGHTGHGGAVLSTRRYEHLDVDVLLKLFQPPPGLHLERSPRGRRRYDRVE